MTNSCQNCQAPNAMRFIVAHEKRGDGLFVQSYRYLCWACASKYLNATQVVEKVEVKNEL